LLADKVVERKIVATAHFNTVGRALKKKDIKPHLKEYWVIPPTANAAFVAAMEDVLEVYTRPHDPARPLVCLDETSKQLVAETRAPAIACALRHGVARVVTGRSVAERVIDTPLAGRAVSAIHP
jgi:hypothetical protein